MERTQLNLPAPDPIQARKIEWVIITPDNAESVFKKIEDSGQDIVLFAITSDGYQQLALTIADLRNLINTQREIIIKYKNYYEPSKKEEK